MIPVSSVLACVVTLFVSLILPVICLIVYARRYKGGRIVSAWFLGAAGFFVPQVLIRLPLLNLLSASGTFQTFAQNHILLYYLCLAFTAGLFEMVGRFVAAKGLGKNLTPQRAVAAGLGHGGIEAMILIGMTYISNLILILMIQTGSFDALIAQTAAAGADVSQLEGIRQALVNTPAGLFLAAGLERILTMICHTALSALVCFGLVTHRTGKCLLLCLVLHTLLDISAAIQYLLQKILSQTAAYCIVYVYLAGFALVSVLILKHIRANWPSTLPEEAEP